MRKSKKTVDKKLPAWRTCPQLKTEGFPDFLGDDPRTMRVATCCYVCFGNELDLVPKSRCRACQAYGRRTPNNLDGFVGSVATTKRKNLPRLTVISYGNEENYAPIILCGGTISGQKLHRIVGQIFKLELSKKIMERTEWARYIQYHSDNANKSESERQNIFRDLNDNSLLAGDEIATAIVKLLVEKYGFTYPDKDEFYINYFHPDREHYWRVKKGR